MTTIFSLPPDQAGYTTSDNLSVVSTQLDGGMSRSRADIAGASSLVNVQWTTDKDGFHYTRIFYRAVAKEGAVPFYIPLYLDFEDVRVYLATFVPGSLKLASTQGLSFVLTAQLEVQQIPYDQSDLDFLEAYQAPGYTTITLYALLQESGDLMTTEDGTTLVTGED